MFREEEGKFRRRTSDVQPNEQVVGKLSLPLKASDRDAQDDTGRKMKFRRKSSEEELISGLTEILAEISEESASEGKTKTDNNLRPR